MNPFIFTGLAVGFAFGFALQRGRFCMNSAFRDIILMKDYTLLKAVGVAILVEMIGFELLSLTGVINLNPKPFMWGANMFGGFIFGIGMVLAGGCASGITYRFGEGMVGAMSAVGGFIFAGLMTSMGILKPVAGFFQNTRITQPGGVNLTLANVLHVPHYVLTFSIAGVALILWAIFTKKVQAAGKDRDVSLGTKIFKKGWGWTATGIVIGLIGILAFYASSSAGRNYPLGITGGYLSIMKSLLLGKNFLTWESMEIISTIIGAFIAALIAGEFKLRAPAPRVLIQTFFGGCLMGFGAVCQMGCNIGHILSGVPQLALSSILGGTFIILGCWLAAYLLFIRVKP